MGLELRDLLGGIVVEDTDLKVVRAYDNPVLAGNEATGADGDIGNLERFDDRLPPVREAFQAIARIPTEVSYDQMLTVPA